MELGAGRAPLNNKVICPSVKLSPFVIIAPPMTPPYMVFWRTAWWCSLAHSTRCAEGRAFEVPEFGERYSNNTLSLQVKGTGVFFIQFHYNAVLFSGIYFWVNLCMFDWTPWALGLDTLSAPPSHPYSLLIEIRRRGREGGTASRA